jgi:DNA-binding response OmpR family regulator
MKTLQTLLIVDDDVSLANQTRHWFDMSHVDATAVYSGEAGIEVLKASPIDVVLLDLRMPRLDGIETLKEMRRIHPDTCIIIFTGFGTIKNAVEAMQEGAAAMLEKIYPLPELEILVKVIHGRHREAVVGRCYLDQQIKDNVFTHMIRGMSHLLKNRLSPIANFLDLLPWRAEPLKGQESVFAEELAAARDATESVEHHVKLLHDAGMGNTLPLATVDLATLAAEARVNIQKYYLPFTDLAGELTIDVCTEETQPAVGNARHLVIALEFLFQNAVDEFLEYSASVPCIDVSFARRDDRVIMTVTDNGPGFSDKLLTLYAEGGDEDDLPLPDDMRRTKPTVSYGTGLRYARTVVRSCGGEFTITNQPRPKRGAMIVMIFRPPDEPETL